MAKKELEPCDLSSAFRFNENTAIHWIHESFAFFNPLISPFNLFNALVRISNNFGHHVSKIGAAKWTARYP